MPTTKIYDIAIIGAGASGLQLLYEIVQADPTNERQILLLDSGDRSTKSWCFWEDEKNECFPFLVEKTWESMTYRTSSGETIKSKIHPLQYKYISSERFFTYFFTEFIPANPHITLVNSWVQKIQEGADLHSVVCKDGSSFYFINGRQSSLTACVNYQGKTTVTSSQFARSLYKGASNNFQISHLLNWLMGKTLLDKRCLLLEASIDSRSPDRDAQLMSAWTELVSYWQKNFPPLRN
jgi:cyanosortase A-associated protein